jgi:hypothetical protein
MNRSLNDYLQCSRSLAGSQIDEVTKEDDSVCLEDLHSPDRHKRNNKSAIPLGNVIVSISGDNDDLESKMNDTFNSSCCSSAFSSGTMPLDMYLSGFAGSNKKGPVVVIDNVSLDISNHITCCTDDSSYTTSTTATPMKTNDVGTSRWESEPSKERTEMPPSHPRMGTHRKDTRLSAPARTSEPSWHTFDDKGRDTAKFEIRKQNMSRSLRRLPGKSASRIRDRVALA